MAAMKMQFERCQHGGSPDESSVSNGEAGRGVYAYLPSAVMRSYYTATGEQVYCLRLVAGEVVDLAGDEMPLLLEFAKAELAALEKAMPGYQPPRVSAANIQRFGRIVEQYMVKKYPDAVAYIVPHKGPGIPTGKQVVIKQLAAFEITEIKSKPSAGMAYEQSDPILHKGIEMDCSLLSPQELQQVYVERHPEYKVLAAEFVKLGLADHPDFVRLMETSVTQPIDRAANERAKLIADRLLDSARHQSDRPNCGVIDGHRCGVQSCDSQSANVYAEIGGEISYVRLDRENQIALKPQYANAAYQFVTDHFEAFEQLCVNLDHAKIASIASKKKPKGTSPGM